MITENLPTLKIHKLTQEQYERELANGNIDETALYLTPEEEVDFSAYATVEQLDGKADSDHTHSYLPLSGGEISNGTIVMNEASINFSNSSLGGIWRDTNSLYSGFGWNDEQMPVILCPNDERKFGVSTGDFDGSYYYYTFPNKEGTIALLDDIPQYITSGAKSGTTIGSQATIEGSENIASGDYSHAEGSNTEASNYASHAEGYFTVASGFCSHAEGGSSTEASGSYSHAEGGGTVASGNDSHAEGSSTEASGSGSHAEGYGTEASGSYSHAEGYYTVASGSYSHAGGYHTVALGDYSHAGGYCTTALGYQFVAGKYNNADTTSIAGVAGVSSADSQSADETLFVIGYGTSTAAGNAFRISANGKCRGVSTFTASGADFAELFEWEDGNSNNEDRRGLFVALEGEKIKLANNGDDFIGVISGAEAFLGNSASEEWQGKYLTDVFGTRLTQTVEIPEKINDVTNEVITPAHTVTQYVLNPDYNPNEKYIMRENRKEWGIVGLLGQVVVIDDGTCVVGGYVKPSLNGVGTASDSGYRVMKRIDETHIKVLVK